MTTHELELSRVPVGELRTYHRNPRRGDLAALRASLKVNGQYKPIVVNRGTHTSRPREVLAGNHTLAAARDEGWADLAVVWVDVDNDQAARIVAADNRTGDLGHYDEQTLADLLGDLNDLDGTGYTHDDLADLLSSLADAGKSGGVDPDHVPPPPREVVTRAGDVWQLGPHRLACVDNLTDTGWASAEVLLTDPPFGYSYTTNQVSRHRGKVIAGDESLDARDKVLEVWGDKPALVFGSWKTGPPAATHTALVWDKGLGVGMGDLSIPWKPNWEPIYVLGRGFHGEHRDSGVVSGFYVDSRGRSHPNQKSVGLLAYLLERCPDGVVADPFAGSGTTLIAAHDVGRVATLTELDPTYCDVICTRYQRRSGELPTRNGEPYDFSTREEHADG